MPIEDLELPPAQVGAHYGYQFESDQQSVSSYAVKEGDLPDGLSLDDRGLLSGVPTTTGHFSFVVITYNHVTGGTEQQAEMDVVAPPELTLGPGRGHHPDDRAAQRLGHSRQLRRRRLVRILADRGAGAR